MSYGICVHRKFMDYHDFNLERLDPEVRNNLKTNKSLRKGFVNIIKIAVECFEAKRVPTAENLAWFCIEARCTESKMRLRFKASNLPCRFHSTSRQHHHREILH
ncbi:hypothetical protein C8Q69DRAFT_482469 [Paecilomyces variotii]|uniref:Uncharacterized protein n=1 Tax=Byssochlamys spectabilis TaxID=264951 RepID=A0A443HIK1_BYSSP|nr:hypothetical protein C8Q69DRAFT_482469 [Paecilomyces variotii]RWQ91587.1 hypothetical protein C8Q69DRAFT_482469 [Paecilomyces variotii]